MTFGPADLAADGPGDHDAPDDADPIVVRPRSVDDTPHQERQIGSHGSDQVALANVLPTPNRRPSGCAAVEHMLESSLHGLEPLQNIGAERVELGAIPDEYDFVVTRQDGTVVWERLYGLDFDQAELIREIEAGEAISFEEVWTGQDTRGRRVGSGTYLVRGVYLGNLLERRGFIWTDPPSPLAIP